MMKEKGKRGTKERNEREEGNEKRPSTVEHNERERSCQYRNKGEKMSILLREAQDGGGDDNSEVLW